MDESKSMKTLQSFSPGWSDPEILEKTLVGRRDLVDRLEELAIDGAGGPNKHQRLIIGFRGSGKTHVLRVLHNRLWSNKELKKRLLIIYLLEDELGVASFLDFVVRLLRAILRWYPEQEELAQGLEEIYDLSPDRQEARAVQLLLVAAGTKDLLIIMENLGITFDQTKGFGVKGQQALRDLIQRHPHFMLFASSQALTESIKDATAPFYSLFKIIHLRRLTLDEAMAFLMAMASAYRSKEILSFLNTAKGRGRMRAIYEFTGGNHRLLVVFYEFLTSDSVARLSDLFIQALDPLKPFYQEQMRGLSAQQQKIIQFLSLQRSPRTVKDIARACLAASNTVSSQLKDLLDKNFVSRIAHGRESYYEITEALFRICHEAELEQEGAPVRLFVDFLGNLYTGEELRLRYRGYSLLAKRVGNEGQIPFAEEAALYSQALSRYYPDFAISSKAPDEHETDKADELHSLFQDMQQSHAYQEIIQMAKYLGEEKDAFILKTEAGAYAQLGDMKKAVVHAREALKANVDDVDAHILLARELSRRSEQRDEALEHAFRAEELAPNDPAALRIVGTVYFNLQDYTEALKQFESLKMKYSDYADGWRLYGRTLEMMNRKEEAECMYRKALELEPKNTNALEELGVLVGNSGRHEEALEHFQGLNEVMPDYADGWRFTGMALVNLGRYEEAEAIYRKALDLEPKNANTLESLGILAGNSGRYEEALEHFQALNGAAPKYGHGWGLTGKALANLSRYEESEAMCRRALDLEPKNTNALEELGVLVGNSGRHKEALEHFQALNDAAPKYGHGWGLTGKALVTLGRNQEAEAICRKGLELEPKNADNYAVLSVVLEKLDRIDEAGMAFKEAERLGADRVWLLNSRGEVRRERGDHLAAISDYEAALRVDPRAVSPHFNIVSALLALGRIDDALVRLPSAIESDRMSKRPFRNDVVTQSFFENCLSLFEFAPTASFEHYLTAALDIIASDEPAYMQRFEESIPLTIFGLLKDQEKLSEVRFGRVLEAFKDIVGKRINVSVAVRFLQTGIDYFKKADHKALLRLTKEERRVFCMELGIA